MIDQIFNSENGDRLVELILPFLGKLILGLVILFFGRILIRWIGRILQRYICKNMDATLAPFMVRISTVGLNILLIISVLSTIGVETTSFAALIGSVGVAFGFAMSGSLQNIASALIILTFKPFVVGDTIKVNDIEGKVKEIKIFNTTIQLHNKTFAFIPNNILTTNEIINYSIDEIRRGTINIGIGYGEDIKKAKDVILKTIESLDFVLSDPAPKIGVSELGDSAVNFKIFVYVKRQDYLNVVLNVYEPIKIALDKNGIEMPFPQIDVHNKK